MIGSLILYLGSVRAGRLLHASILRNIMTSPMVFFDTNPIGRILNRFSKDIDTVDNMIARSFHSWLGCTLRCITVPFVVAYTTPLFIAVAIPLGIFYYVIQVGIFSKLQVDFLL